MNSFSVTISTTINQTQPPPPPPPPPPSHGFLPLLNHRTPLLPPPLLPYKPKQKLPHSFPHFHLRAPGPFSPLPCASTPHKPNPRKKRDPSFSAATPKATTPPCTECGKSFSSWKALFGHMRCHPERQWRGINPPAHLRRPAGARRFTDEEYEVASSLLMLSRGPPKDNGGAPREEARCGHRCNVCSRGVSTGQTLGGYKRGYGEKKGGGEDGGAGCSSRCYSLDLNSLPPLESNEGIANSVLDLRLGI